MEQNYSARTIEYQKICDLVKQINSIIPLMDWEKLYVGFTLVGIDDINYSSFFSNNYFAKACNIQRMLSINEYLDNLNHCDIVRLKNIECLLRAEKARLFFPKKDNQNYLETYKKNGWCRLPSVFDRTLCEETRDSLLQIAEQEKNSNLNYVYGADLRLRRVYYLLKKKPSLASFLVDKVLIDLLDELFARETPHPKYHLTGFHCNILESGAGPHKLHIDDNLPFDLPNWGIRTSFHFVLQDNARDSGSTLYLQNSHLLNRVPTLQEVNELPDSSLLAMEAKVGDLLMWSGRLWHKSGANESHIDRVALLATFVPSFLLDIALEENYYKYLDGKEIASIPEILRRFINWEQGTK